MQVEKWVRMGGMRCFAVTARFPSTGLNICEKLMYFLIVAHETGKRMLYILLYIFHWGRWRLWREYVGRAGLLWLRTQDDYMVILYMVFEY